MRSNAQEIVCAILFCVLLKVALYEQRCLSWSVVLKVVLIKLLQLTDFAQTNQASEASEPLMSASTEMPFSHTPEQQIWLMIVHSLHLQGAPIP